MENPKNPYKKIAELHNQGLDYVIGELSRQKKKGLSREQIVESVCGYLMQISGQASKLDEAINYSVFIQLLNNKEKDSDIQNIKSLDLSKNAEKIITTLLEIKSKESKVILSTIAELEQQALNDDFNERDRSCTLLLLAIAEMSVTYWENETKKRGSLWQKVFGKVKKLPWKADVKAGAKALVNPSIDILFEGTLARPVIMVVRVLGNAIIGSALEYKSEVRNVDIQKDAPSVVESRIKTLRNNPPKVKIIKKRK